MPCRATGQAEVADLVLGAHRGSLQAIRGIQLIHAATIMVELGDLCRMGYLKLVPDERSTGNTVRRLGITKAGNGRVRRVGVADRRRVLAAVSSELGDLSQQEDRAGDRFGGFVEAVLDLVRELDRLAVNVHGARSGVRMTWVRSSASSGLQSEGASCMASRPTGRHVDLVMGWPASGVQNAG